MEPGRSIAVVRTVDGPRAGLAVVVDERLITCAHVVNTALGRARNDATEPDGQVALLFPFVDGAEVEAGISVWGPGGDWAPAKDFAVLTPRSSLPDGIAPANFRAIKAGIDVRICGPSRDHGTALDFVTGTVAGERRPRIWQLHQRRGPFRVQGGYSGGPVVLPDTNEVVGLTRATRDVHTSDLADVEVLDIAGPADAMDIALAPCRQPEEQTRPSDGLVQQQPRRARVWAVLGMVVLLLAAAGGLGWQLLSARGDNDASGSAADPSGSNSSSTGAEPSSSESLTPTVPATTSPSKKEPPKEEVPVEAEPVPADWVIWASTQSGMCIGVEFGAQADSTAVVQAGREWETRCSWEHEKWSFVTGYGPDGTWFKIVNRNSGKCLDTYKGSTDLGAEIVQNTCTDSGGSQVWHLTFDKNEDGWIYWRSWRNLKSGYCVDNRSETDTEGLHLWQAICNDTATAQLFRLQYA